MTIPIAPREMRWRAKTIICAGTGWKRRPTRGQVFLQIRNLVVVPTLPGICSLLPLGIGGCLRTSLSFIPMRLSYWFSVCLVLSVAMADHWVVGRTSIIVPTRCHAPGLFHGSSHPADKASEPPAVEDSSTDCVHLRRQAEIWSSPGNSQKGYDTVRAYLTQCYSQKQSYGYFTYADNDNDDRNNDLNRYVEYREWLKSVLYLRSDSLWYCRDVTSIAGTMSYFQGHGIYFNAAIAIANYVLEHNRCDSSYFLKGRVGEAAFRDQVWRDTVKDSLNEPRPDTTLPSLEDIGLGLLRGPKPAVVAGAPSFQANRISDIRATENPFASSTAIGFDLSDYGLVTFQLFDPLGKEVTTNGIGQVLDPGPHSFEIDGRLLSRGVYFARISYHGGEAKTVMIRKE